MGSVLTSTANVALFVLGCFLAADTANEVIGAMLLAPSQEAAAPAGAEPPARQRTWAERQIILSRNLFNSATLAPDQDDLPAPEEVEKSKLPVKLLGTFASTDDALSRATLQDKENNETLVVGIGDQIKGKALVTRIERRRVLLTENGAPRELTLDEETSSAPAVTRRSRTRTPPQRASRTPRRAVERTGDGNFEVDRAQVEETLRNPSQLLSQARILPKFEDGEMVGLQVNSIKAGSLFEEIGLSNGDIITEFNGISIDSPDQSARILQEFSDATEFDVTVRSADGSESPIHFVPRN